MKIASAVFVLLLIYLNCTAQKTAQERKDSLSRISMRRGPSNEKPQYLLDSAVLMSVSGLGNLGNHSSYVKLIGKTDNIATFYVHTGRTIILDGKVVQKSSTPFDTQQCKTIRTKTISPHMLLTDFGISNERGGIAIRCLVKQ